jgi:hypothetical protein
MIAGAEFCHGGHGTIPKTGQKHLTPEAWPKHKKADPSRMTGFGETLP